MLSRKLSSICKLMFLMIFLGISVNASAHSSITIRVGSPAYYPAPVYYAPPVVQTVTWVPAHQEYGYWVPGHYVQYLAPSPQPQVVWARGGYYGHHGHRYYYY